MLLREQFLLFFHNISLPVVRFSYLKQGPDFSLRDKWLFEISEVEITRLNCIPLIWSYSGHLFGLEHTKVGLGYMLQRISGSGYVPLYLVRG